MTNTALEKSITLNQLAVMMQMLKALLDNGKINRALADTTAQRIALKYELSPIYLW
ncbi:hypothetical protein [Pygmaiobacter massiliensis]|uniref:hypothetical protein n=1 Tax=Pygmaiobacter massiliensis TaxID=1917873 RepID=UPI002897F95A|nr:hypothetical protein [Pygmaiobacter massiliensis]